jgi:hypothetical protein
MRHRLALLLSALLAVPAFAQEKPKPIAAHPKVDQQKVDEAIEKGCKSLVEGGQAMGMFPHGQRHQPVAQQAYAELVLLTLLHSGNYAEGDVAIQPIVDYVLQKPIGSTYTAALMAMALQKLNSKKYQERIALCAQFLCDNQCENGQWDYGEPVSDPPPMKYDLPKRPKKPDDVATGGGDPNAPPSTAGKEDGSGPKAESKAGKTTAEGKKPGKTTQLPRIPVRKRKNGPPNGDNSNSQYAALGLRACLDANIDVDVTVLDRARKWWVRSQNSDGGWGYNGNGDMGGGGNENGVSNDSYGSMTVGAVGALCIYDYFLGIQYKNDGNVLKGLEWIAKNFDVTKNPKKTNFAYLYYLYGLERVGMLYGTDRIGPHEWYPVGANHLLAIQKDGIWVTDDRIGRGSHVETCFAILFLRKGTPPLKPPPPPPNVATGGPAGAPVANGPPVDNGVNRAGLAVNRVVDAAAPGWRLLNCKPELHKSVTLLGKERVLQTIEEGSARRPTLRRMIDANASGPAVKATVGHNPGDKWTLIVLVDTKEVTTKEISEETCKEGWTDVVVDLLSFAGKSVLVELIAAGGDSALWASVTVGDR